MKLTQNQKVAIYGSALQGVLVSQGVLDSEYASDKAIAEAKHMIKALEAMPDEQKEEVNKKQVDFSKTFECNMDGLITFPLYIGKIDFNGQVSYPNSTVASVKEFKNLLSENVKEYSLCSRVSIIYYSGYRSATLIINDTAEFEFECKQ